MRDVNGWWSPRAVLTIGAAAAVVFVLAPVNSAVQIIPWFVPLVMAVVLLPHTRRYRKGSARERRPLGLLLAGVVGYLAASLVWYIPPTVLEIALPFPSPLDLAYFTVYSIYAGFLLVVIRRQRSTDLVDSRLALIDAPHPHGGDVDDRVGGSHRAQPRCQRERSGDDRGSRLSGLHGAAVRARRAPSDNQRDPEQRGCPRWCCGSAPRSRPTWCTATKRPLAASSTAPLGGSCGWCRARASRRWGSTRPWTTCSADQAGASPNRPPPPPARPWCGVGCSCCTPPPSSPSRCSPGTRANSQSCWCRPSPSAWWSSGWRSWPATSASNVALPPS